MQKEHIFLTEDRSNPYCDIVITEDKYLFLSGLVSQDLSSGELKYGSITEETCQVLQNLKCILEQNGSDMDHVIRAQVLLRHFSERDEMNAEYMKHFNPDKMPARLCYGDVGLAGECKIEIMVTAVKKA